MQRITISVDDDLLAQFDAFMAEKGYGNRSEAFRDLVRERLRTERLSTEVKGDCIACFSYVYGHQERQLSRRLVEAQHAHHDLGLSTLHVHLDHDNCMEAVILRGAADSVQHFADDVAAQGGVRYSNLHLVPIRIDEGGHSHGEEERPNGAHLHSHPAG